MTQVPESVDAPRETPETPTSSITVTGVEVLVVAVGPEDEATPTLEAPTPDDRTSEAEVSEYVQLVDDAEREGLLAARRRDTPAITFLRKAIRIASLATSNVWSVLTHSLFLDAYCVLVLWGVTYLFFEPSLRDLRIAYENDTRVFYYPIFVKLGEAWRSGHLQLWSTDILTGYPVFADGEAGVLYPFHLLPLMFLPVDGSFVWC